MITYPDDRIGFGRLAKQDVVVGTDPVSELLYHVQQDRHLGGLVERVMKFFVS